jgi:hypothetical protein
MVETLGDLVPESAAKSELMTRIAIVQQAILAFLPFFSLQQLPATWPELEEMLTVIAAGTEVSYVR